MHEAKLARVRHRVVCESCAAPIGIRVCEGSWVGADGRVYSSPRYGVALVKGYHWDTRAHLFLMPPRVRARAIRGQFPALRRGHGRGPGNKWTYGHLSAVDARSPSMCLVRCWECQRLNKLVPERLDLLDWTPDPRFPHRIRALPTD